MIAIVLPDLRGGGAERVMIDLAKEFSYFGHDVEFVLMDGCGDFLAECKKHFRVISLKAPRIRNVPLALSHYLRNNRPDFMIANMWPLTSASVLAKKISRQKFKLLLVEHNTLRQQYYNSGYAHGVALPVSISLTYRFADYIAAVSEGSAKDLAKLAKVPDNAVTVLHNGIPAKARPDQEAIGLAERIWACKPGKRVLTVGSLKTQKNHALLLDSFAKLGDRDAKLMLVGKGEEEASLKSMAARLGISDRVIFAGFHLNPSMFYATADLFVLSSDYEGLPTVLIEAMSFGVPVVSTDCPSGPSEILEGGRLGWLVPVGDAVRLAQAIELGLSTPVDRTALLRRADDFRPRNAARRYLQLLELA